MAVFHLKYRPQKFGELDLVEVGEKLKKTLEEKECPQSFLFAGPKGAGKTSAARILAKAINCLTPEGVEPCGKCENCIGIANGETIDIMEIDAASNRGIDDVRLIKDRAYLSPAKLKKKVFIIDEVHMLTKEAFNALLKLIEEPPKHTVFIMCTTDPEKIPETVLSRLVRVDFKKGKIDELKSSLKKIIDGEKIKIKNEAIEIIVKNNDGSFRNLQKMFNEMVMEIGKEMDKESVEKFFEKKQGEYSMESLEEDLLAGDKKGIIGRMEKMAENGVDFGEYRNRALDWFQKRMIDVKLWEIKELVRWINLLIDAGRKEKYTEIGQLPMELAVIDFLGDENKIQLSKINDQKVVEKLVINRGTENSRDAINRVSTKKNLNITVEQVAEKWKDLLLAVKPYNHSVEAFLRAARPKEIDGGRIVFEVFYQFHKDRLEDAKNRKIVEVGLNKIFGQDVDFVCVLGKNNVTEKKVISAEEEKVEVKKEASGDEIYDAAKEIFG